jgi:hypothetical protein
VLCHSLFSDVGEVLSKDFSLCISDIWRAFGVLMLILEPQEAMKGLKLRVRLFLFEYSKIHFLLFDCKYKHNCLQRILLQLRGNLSVCSALNLILENLHMRTCPGLNWKNPHRTWKEFAQEWKISTGFFIAKNYIFLPLSINPRRDTFSYSQ